MDLKEVLDWILRIVGAFSIITKIISFIFNLFKNKTDYSNIRIIANPTEEDLNTLIHHEEFSLENYSSHGESTLLAPVDSALRDVKLYKLYITKNGKLKKGNVVFKIKKLSPNHGVLFNIYKNCGAPSYMLSWKNNSGYVAEYVFAENGFNGNTNYNIIEYKSSLINYIFHFTLSK